MPNRQVLLIRSASFQQLDRNLPELEKAFPNHEFNMLTHEHGVESARRYGLLKHVYAYPYKESFDYCRKPVGLPEERFDSVIVPVSNLTGAGFMNVLLFSLRIPARKRYLCNMASEIREITAFSILAQGAMDAVYKAAALLLTFALMLPASLLLSPFLMCVRKRQLVQRAV
jgi:hypothetical protein